MLSKIQETTSPLLKNISSRFKHKGNPNKYRQSPGLWSYKRNSTRRINRTLDKSRLVTKRNFLTPKDLQPRNMIQAGNYTNLINTDLLYPRVVKLSEIPVGKPKKCHQFTTFSGITFSQIPKRTRC